MHGLTVDHNPAVEPPSTSTSLAHAVSPLSAPLAAVPDRVEAAASVVPRMTPMLGGMCLAVLLAAGINLLVQRAGSAAGAPRWLGRSLHCRSFKPWRGHDPPGSLLLRLCVMRT